MIKTRENEDIAAFYKHNGKVYRVIDKVSDYYIHAIGSDNQRWFSTHSALNDYADIALALSSYFKVKILQKDIDYTF